MCVCVYKIPDDFDVLRWGYYPFLMVTGIVGIYLIYFLTAIGLSPGGSSTVHIYTQTVHRRIQNKQYIEQHNNYERERAMPRIG
jgi:hypothetical protein